MDVLIYPNPAISSPAAKSVTPPESSHRPIFHLTILKQKPNIPQTHPSSAIQTKGGFQCRCSALSASSVLHFAFRVQRFLSIPHSALSTLHFPAKCPTFQKMSHPPHYSQVTKDKGLMTIPCPKMSPNVPHFKITLRPLLAPRRSAESPFRRFVLRTLSSRPSPSYPADASFFLVHQISRRPRIPAGRKSIIPISSSA